MKDFHPLPPPDSDDPDDIAAWMRAEAEHLAAWTEQLNRSTQHIERVNNFLSIGVPALFVGIALLYAARRQWGMAAFESGLAVSNVAFRIWIERRTARRIAKRQAVFEELKAQVEREWEQ